MTRKRKYKTMPRLQKAIIILVLKGGIVIQGDGTFEGRNVGGQAVFTATLVKKIPK